MRFVEADQFTGTKAWDALDLATFSEASVRLHWTDEPYVWHVNDGSEVFVVLDGSVDMHYREDGEEHVQALLPGSMCVVEVGDEHVAHPTPEARILVIEQPGSV